MKIQSVLKKSTFLLALLAGITVGVCSYAGANEILPPQSKAESNTHFPKNESGETYGSARGVSPYEKKPDLIEARGVDGKKGYVRYSDLVGKEPKTIEEALAEQAKEETNVINVYESDGKKIIDKFELKPNRDNEKSK